MAISRTGTCPIFLEYVTKQALVPRTSPTMPEFTNLTQYNFDWIDIPNYQRGIVWDDELFEELLRSKSIFLGSAILGSFPVAGSGLQSAFLPPSVTHYSIIIDGLQRFSIGTALLTILHPLVLADHPQLANEATYFTALKANAVNHAPIFQHNNQELQNHPRKAVSESYTEFRNILGRWLQNEFQRNDVQQLARDIERLFLERQIAPDRYFGFTSAYDVTSTFIGLNTIREQLSTVDWLRSVIVEKGAQTWTSQTIEDIENRFTEVFSRTGGSGDKKDLLPFAAIILECLTSEDSYQRTVFPSWNRGLQESEVMSFLEFVDDMYNVGNNAFYKEIRECGAIPFAGLICYYYRSFLEKGQQPILIGGSYGNDTELLMYLRANYRVLLEGRIGRTREYSKKLLTTPQSLVDIAEKISFDFIGCRLVDRVDRLWLQARLKDTDKAKARRIFNACILPSHGSASIGFAAHNYGTKTRDYQIDHMIPESALRKNCPGENEGRRIMNFAPVRRSANNQQSNLQCSSKLSTAGSYQSETVNDPNHHPYIDWLIQTQNQHASFLDRQDLLMTNSNPPIGNERIEWLTDRLITRL